MFSNINETLEREQIAADIKKILAEFETECNNPTYKKGIYIYGSPGCGKTAFVVNLLNEMNYDIVKYDAGDIRNKSLIETITHNNISSYNVLQQMRGKPKKIAIVMDEIDGMNNGDKGGITSLIKLIRQKKTKKQKLENKTMNPIICIGNYYVDKKIKELMKVSNVFELKTPTNKQIQTIFESHTDIKFNPNILDYIRGDLRKLEFICKISKTDPTIITNDTIKNIFQHKNYNEDIKHITQTLFKTNMPLSEHCHFMNDTERTIVALLWHENIIDILKVFPLEQQQQIYLQILDNICFADYMDRITFQNQIWEFNEMTSLIKIFHNNKIFHDKIKEKNLTTPTPNDIRFTKVLTKYSTEYNNQLFITNLCQELDMDKKDMFSLFYELRTENENNNTDISAEFISKLSAIFEKYNINKLDIKRIYKYLDKNIKKSVIVDEEDDEDEYDIVL